MLTQISLATQLPPSPLLATYYLISWLAAVHQISEENSILGAGKPASRDFAGTLLNADTLVILIDGLRGTKKWSWGLSLCGKLHTPPSMELYHLTLTTAL